MTPKRYLIALDLDGTLLNSQGEVSEATRQYLRELEHQGHIIVLASGRPIRAILPIYQKLSLTSPIICYNGAYIAHPHGPIYSIYEHSFSRKVIFSVIDQLSPYLENAMCETNTDIWLLKEDEVLCRFFWHEGMEIHYGPFQDSMDRDPMTLILYFQKDADRTKVQQIIDQYPNLSIRFWSGIFARVGEVYDSELSKASALAYLYRYLHIPASQTIAIGDADNDLAMLKATRYGVAMINGEEHLKQAADYVSNLDNDHDGVIDILKQILATL